jgi:hypothetical protein
VGSHPFRKLREMDGARGFDGRSSIWLVEFVVSHPFRNLREMDGARGIAAAVIDGLGSGARGRR